VFGVIGLVFVIVGLVSLADAVHLNQLQRDGVRVPAQVVAARTDYRSGYRSSSTDYYLKCQCTLPDGKVATQEFSVGVEVYTRLGHNVEFAPREAEAIVLPDNSEWMLALDVTDKLDHETLLAWLLPLIGMAFFAVSAASVISWHKTRRGAAAA
jgi:hypothetical protein